MTKEEEIRERDAVWEKTKSLEYIDEGWINEMGEDRRWLIQELDAQRKASRALEDLCAKYRKTQKDLKQQLAKACVHQQSLKHCEELFHKLAAEAGVPDEGPLEIVSAVVMKLKRAQADLELGYTDDVV